MNVCGLCRPEAWSGIFFDERGDSTRSLRSVFDSLELGYNIVEDVSKGFDALIHMDSWY